VLGCVDAYLACYADSLEVKQTKIKFCIILLFLMAFTDLVQCIIFI
jgi:hypothetical protein